MRNITVILFCVSLCGCGGRDERHYELALRYKETGDYDKAIEELQAAVKDNPRFAKAHNQLGILYGKVGLYKKAVDQCRRAVEEDPGFASAYYNLGVLYHNNLNEPVEAISAYSRYLELSPEGKKADAVRRIVHSLMQRPGIRDALSESVSGQQREARRFKAEGKYIEAIAVYKKVLAAAPRSAAQANLEIARIYEEKLDNLEEALKYYQVYLDANINAPDAAEVMAVIGGLREKVTLAPKPKQVPRDTLRKAEDLLKQKKVAEAMELLERARDESRDNEQIHDLLAEAYMTTGDMKGAEKEYEWLKSRQSDFAYNNELLTIYSKLANSNLERGEYGRAEERFLKALKIDKNNDSLRRGLALALAGQGKFQRAIKEAAVTLPQRQDGEGKKEMAALYLGYARHLSANGQYERAVEAFKEAKTLQPGLDLSSDMTDLCELRARLAKENGHFEMAEKEYLKAIQIEPNRWRLHRELASLYEQMGQYEKALDEFEKVGRHGMDGAPAFKEMARIYEVYMGEGVKALEYYRRYLKVYPKAPDADEIKEKLRESEQEKIKIVEYERAVKRKPANATTHYNLAVLLQRQGKLREAIKEYRKALSIEPRNAQACFNLGYSYDRLRMYDNAIKEYRKAIQYKPDYVKAYNNLAAIYKTKGWYGKAIAVLTKALAIDSAYAQAHLGLGAIYADELKDRKKAIYHYQQYLRLQPNGTFSPQVRSWLKRMG